MTTNFQINGVDWDDLYVRRSTFTEGGLWVWGNNDSGRLGTGNTTHRSSPVQVLGGGTNWKDVGSGGNHSIALKSDGTLWLWGIQNVGGLFPSGQLGDASTVSFRSSPVQTVSGGTNWRQAAGGAAHTAAIKTDGSLWTWGWNNGLGTVTIFGAGALGDGTITTRSSPVQTIAGGTNWRQVECGYFHTSSIKTDGTLWTWGDNTNGQLGDATIVHRSSPIQTVAGGNNWKQLACGDRTTLSIKTDGTLWTWGLNARGQLGTDNTTSRSSPAQTISGGTNWKAINGGVTVGALKTDGTLWVWGHNEQGQLGDGTVIHRSSPVQTLSGGTNWKLLSMTENATGAIKTDGSLWVWGLNANGQLGDGTITNRSSPIQTIMGGYNWKTITSSASKFIAVVEDYW